MEWCFNGKDTYQLDWRPWQDFDAAASGDGTYPFTLTSFEDEDGTIGQLCILRVVTSAKSFFINYNRAIGANIEVADYRDLVVVSEVEVAIGEDLDTKVSRIVATMGQGGTDTLVNAGGSGFDMTILVGQRIQIRFD